MRFEVLPGLPPYGPPAVSFTERGDSEFREGLVVRFYPKMSEPWIGNFLGGMSDYTNVFDHPNGTDVIVVAWGETFIIDPGHRAIREHLASDTQRAIPVPALGLVLFQGLVGFNAVRSDGSRWRSPRISWDSFRDINVVETELTGEAWTPIGDAWVPFALDLLTGRCTGAIYEADMTRSLRATPRVDLS
ncbi:hypothetical protein LPJ38_14085 [Bradyrhizobium daqingense]|uniref:Uncharacterized protein n=1 Tax=Bradyrhizobium daqingense TaxID=993502 RepID=A0A562L9E3_9BRAD|nr:hypothetical protein [Bradyrhizobium daqingense]TWI04263.1 hypothetical protein IQ17_03587 [Bradyrhizobium daqingense]UFS91805.1 hypothetical protein LPJ38_14085 [Bradyrhizobium daqingense]